MVRSRHGGRRRAYRGRDRTEVVVGRRRRSSLHGVDGVDPVAFVPNLFDAILVLTVALFVSLSAAHAKAARAVPDGQKLEGFVDTGIER